MDHDQRLAGLEATAVDMERLGHHQRARMIRAVLVPYYTWLADEMHLGMRPSETADALARGFGNMVEFFAAFAGGTKNEQRVRCIALVRNLEREAHLQHEGRFGRHLT